MSMAAVLKASWAVSTRGQFASLMSGTHERWYCVSIATSRYAGLHKSVLCNCKAM